MGNNAHKMQQWVEHTTADRSAPAYTISHAALDELAGRVLTDGEVARVVKSLDYSSLSDVLHEVMASTVGLADVGEEDETD